MIAGVSSPRRRPPAAFALFVAILIGGLAGSFGLAPAASAHAVLVTANPVQNSILPTAPGQVTLQFSESVTLIAGKVRVIAPDGTRADTDQTRTSGDQVIIPLKPGAAQGTYLVSYRVISADSHPVAGSYTYSVGRTSTAPVDSDVAAASSPVVSVLFPIVRWIGYVGLVLLVGSVLVLALLWPQRLDRAGPIRVIWIGAGLVAAAAIGELLVQIPYVAGGFGQIRSADVQEVLSSQFGAAHLIRLGVLGAALFLLRPIVRGKGWGADRVLLAVLGAIAVATWSVSGHPYASPIPTVTVVADMIHIASMAVWLGGLFMLAVFLLPRASATELAAIVPVWSRWAAYAVSTLLFTGVAQALVEIGSVPALFTTTYGLLVLTKVVLLGLVLIVASFSRRQVPAIMQRARGAAGRLRSLVAAEAIGAIVVIGVASVLVQVTPARSAPASSAPTIQSASLAAPSGLFLLTVDASPANVGAVQLHMYATDAKGVSIDIEEWTVTAALPSHGIEPMEVPVLNAGAGHGIGQISLPTAGAWAFTFTLRTSEIDEDSVSTSFTISN